MKKAISLVLCLLIAFGALSMFASAEDKVYYKLEVNTEHGQLICYVNGQPADSAVEGEVIVVEAIPDDGYYLDESSVKYGYGDGTPIKKDAAGFYSFKMPHYDTVISATFKDKLAPAEIWNAVKPIGSNLLDVIKSLLPLLKAVFGNIVEMFKTGWSQISK